MQLLTVNNLADFAESRRILNVEATQRSVGRFKYNEQRLSLPFLEVNYWSVSTEMIYTLSLKEDRIIFSIPVHRPWQRINGVRLSQFSEVCILPNEQIIVQQPENISSLDFSICMSVFTRHFTNVCPNEIKRLIRSHRESKSHRQDIQFAQSELISFTLNVMKRLDSLNYQALLDAQDSIFIMLFNIIRKSRAAPSANSRNSKLIVVRRAIDFLQRNHESLPGALELADKCFCSIRTLEYAFKGILDITPKEYLVVRRMNLIKREFEKSASSSINSTIEKFGVCNLSRFSQDYSRFFGERPLETREKSKGNRVSRNKNG